MHADGQIEEEQEIELEVVVADAIAKPSQMMMHTQHTLATHMTVMCSIWLP